MLNIKVEAERLAEKLAFTKAQTAKVVAVTITQAAYNVQKGIQGEMQKRFDRPTPFVLKSVFVKQAKVSGEQVEPAIIGIRGSGSSLKVAPSHVLYSEVMGGQRRAKRAEILLRKVMPAGYTQMVPGAGAPLDAHGNIPGAYLQKVFSALQLQFDQAANSAIPGTSGLRRSDLKRAARLEREQGGAQFGKHGRLKGGLRGYGAGAQAYLLERIARQDKNGRAMGANFFVGKSKGKRDQRIVYQFDWQQRPGKPRPNNPNPSPVLTKTNVRPVIVFTRQQNYKVRLPMLEIANETMSSPALRKILDDTAMRLFTKWNAK